MPHLTLPSAQFRGSYVAAAGEYADEGAKGLWFVTSPTFDAGLQRLIDLREGRNVPEGFVTYTFLWLVTENEYLGHVSIRHVLNPWLEKFAGHIGYRIRPRHRRQGYGRLIVRLALPEAHRLGINPAVVTCDATNIASRKIIEANGGVLQDHVDRGEGLPPKLRFWVPTDPSGQGRDAISGPSASTRCDTAR
jgi:predicted acetyltransferase